MRVTVLGAGLVGRAIAYRLSRSSLFDEITVVDALEHNLKIVQKICGTCVRTIKANITKNYNIVETSDIVSCALPGSISFDICKKILGFGIHVVDSSFSPQDPFKLSNIARDNGVVYIPDAGFAPGMSNIFVGHMTQNIGSIHSVEIYVGGLPIRPDGPFYHLVNWSLSDFVEEYIRPARIIRNGKQTSVDPLESIEQIKIEDELFEAFYTDGLRTLLKTIEADNMFEKTLRYAGHLERMRFLRDLGLFSDEHIDIGGIRIKAKDILIKLLKKYIYKPNIKDRVLLYIRVRSRGSKKIKETFFEEYFDEELSLSAMGKTTGYTNAILTEAVAEVIRHKGIYPPEIFGKEHMDYFLDKYNGGTGEIRIRRREEIEIKIRGRKMYES